MKKVKMNTKKESHCWWFDSHNASNSSPWLKSTLQELNEKTKMMLKLVEDDADSFAQRAEMYYKKRPELISMVEDFYRAHRSLAERYDQLKSTRSVNIKSPLRHLVCHPKDENEDGLNSIGSVKSFDSFTEVVYSSDDESPESEVDDPELEEVSQIEVVSETTLSALSGNCELTEVSEEVDHLREENETQKNPLPDKSSELEKLRGEFDAIREEYASLEEVKMHRLDVDYQIELLSVKPLAALSGNSELATLREELDRLQEVNGIQENQLAEKISELEKLREEFDAVKEENASFEDVKTVKCDVKSLKLYDTDQTEQNYVTNDEGNEFTIQFDEVRNVEMIKLWDEIQNLGVERMKQREIVKQEFLKIETENTFLKETLSIKQALLEQETEEKINLTRLLEKAKTELDKTREETLTQNMNIEKLLLKVEQLKCDEKEAKRQLLKMTEELINLREETQRKDRCLIEALDEKDEEKRAVIRQLSLAMEVLREDNLFLKKAIVTCSSKKTNRKWFNSSSKRKAGVV